MEIFLDTNQASYKIITETYCNRFNSAAAVFDLLSKTIKIAEASLEEMILLTEVDDISKLRWYNEGLQVSGPIFAVLYAVCKSPTPRRR